ncbi:MAG: hypothetical protein EZS28_020485, partial [Streblomastix strix]
SDPDKLVFRRAVALLKQKLPNTKQSKKEKISTPGMFDVLSDMMQIRDPKQIEREREEQKLNELEWERDWKQRKEGEKQERLNKDQEQRQINKQLKQLQQYQDKDKEDQRLKDIEKKYQNQQDPERRSKDKDILSQKDNQNRNNPKENIKKKQLSITTGSSYPDKQGSSNPDNLNDSYNHPPSLLSIRGSLTGECGPSPLSTPFYHPPLSDTQFPISQSPQQLQQSQQLNQTQNIGPDIGIFDGTDLGGQQPPTLLFGDYQLFIPNYNPNVNYNTVSGYQQRQQIKDQPQANAPRIQPGKYDQEQNTTSSSKGQNAITISPPTAERDLEKSNKQYQALQRVNQKPEQGQIGQIQQQLQSPSPHPSNYDKFISPQRSQKDEVKSQPQKSLFSFLKPSNINLNLPWFGGLQTEEELKRREREIRDPEVVGEKWEYGSEVRLDTSRESENDTPPKTKRSQQYPNSGKSGNPNVNNPYNERHLTPEEEQAQFVEDGCIIFAELMHQNPEAMQMALQTRFIDNLSNAIRPSSYVFTNKTTPQKEAMQRITNSHTNALLQLVRRCTPEQKMYLFQEKDVIPTCIDIILHSPDITCVRDALSIINNIVGGALYTVGSSNSHPYYDRFDREKWIDIIWHLYDQQETRYPQKNQLGIRVTEEIKTLAVICLGRLYQNRELPIKYGPIISVLLQMIHNPDKQQAKAACYIFCALAENQKNHSDLHSPPFLLEIFDLLRTDMYDTHINVLWFFVALYNKGNAETQRRIREVLGKEKEYSLIREFASFGGQSIDSVAKLTASGGYNASKVANNARRLLELVRSKGPE